MTISKIHIQTIMGIALTSVAPAWGQSYGVTTIAGANSLNDNASATTNFLRQPSGVTVDGNANIYLSDGDDNRIRRITPGGIITTIAGNGKSGYSGDGGQAVNAQLSGPQQLSLDRKTNLLYVVDYLNYSVREINLQSGVIRSVAGSGSFPFSGPGPDATKIGMSPSGVAADNGIIYIADDLNHRIYRVTASTGALTLLAGAGGSGNSGDNGPAAAAKFFGPTQLALDVTSNVLFVIDYYNTRVRKVQLQSGIVTGAAGDGFPTTDGTGGNALVASVFFPDAIAVDEQGNLYISEALQIRKVTAATSIISLIAGTITPGFSGDGGPSNQARLGFSQGVASIGNGDLIVADTDNHRVRKIVQGTINTIAGTDIRDGGQATSAFLNTPRGILKDAAGNIYLSDTRNYFVRKISPSGVISSIGGTGGYGTQADRITDGRTLAFDSKGNLYVPDARNNRIAQISASGTTKVFAGSSSGASGASAEGVLATTAKFNRPTSIAIDANDNVYVADWLNSRVRKIDPVTGLVTTVAGNGTPTYSGDGGFATAAGINPYGLAFDKQGNLLISDYLNNRIRRLDVNTGRISLLAGDGTAANTNDNIAAASASITRPEQLTVDAQGNVFVTHAGFIHKISAAGIVSKVAGNGNFTGGKETGAGVDVAMDPVDVRVNSDGGILFADYSNHKIRLLTPLKPANLTISGGNNQSVPAGANLTISVKLTDAASLLIFNEPVTFTVVSGTATLSKATVNTGTDGVASTVVLVGANAAGLVTVRAVAAGLNPVTFVLSPTAAVTAPTISSGGVAGAPLSGPPVKALSRNGIASVFGSNFAAAGTSKIVSPADLDGGKIPINFAGVCVQVGAVKAPIYAVFANQVNFQVPELPAGAANVDVRVLTDCGTAKEQVSAPESVAARAAVPEFFYFAQTADGKNPIAAANAVSGQLIGPSFVAAKPGDVLTLYGTGFGDTEPNLDPGQIPISIASVKGSIQMKFGGRVLATSNVLYVGIAPFNPGLYQVNLIVPSDAADGNQTVELQIGDQSSPLGPYILVKSPNGSTTNVLHQDELSKAERESRRRGPDARVSESIHRQRTK